MTGMTPEVARSWKSSGACYTCRRSCQTGRCYGLCLHIRGMVSSIRNLEISSIIRHIWPFILLLYGILILCIAVPDIFMFLPRLLGYVQ